MEALSPAARSLMSKVVSRATDAGFVLDSKNEILEQIRRLAVTPADFIAAAELVQNLSDNLAAEFSRRTTPQQFDASAWTSSRGAAAVEGLFGTKYVDGYREDFTTPPGGKPELPALPENMAWDNQGGRMVDGQWRATMEVVALKEGTRWGPSSDSTHFPKPPQGLEWVRLEDGVFESLPPKYMFQLQKKAEPSPASMDGLEKVRRAPVGNDPIGIADAQVKGDVLEVKVEHGGGFKKHDYGLVWDGGFLESFPVQTSLKISHNAHDDHAEAFITKTLKFDLTPLRDSYRAGYQDQHGEIRFSIPGLEKRLSYTF